MISHAIGRNKHLFYFFKDLKLHELKLAADHVKGDPTVVLLLWKFRFTMFFFFFLSLSYTRNAFGVISENHNILSKKSINRDNFDLLLKLFGWLTNCFFVCLFCFVLFCFILFIYSIAKTK